MSLLERLQTDILVADGAMGTLLYAYGLDTCHEAYNLTHPEQVKAIHQAYCDAGADIIQTNTYGAKRHRLKSYGYEENIKTINQEAAYLARAVAGDKQYVLGTIGASRGLRQCELSLDDIIAETLEQVGYLLETQVLDGLLFETYYDMEELSRVLEAVRPITNLPIITNITLHEAGITENGRPLVEAFSQLIMLGADVVGLNCHLGPYHMIQSLKQIPLFAQAYLAVYPNASLMSLQTTTDHNRFTFSNNAAYFGQSSELLVKEGARIIGGCCGTTPAHIRAIKQAVKSLKPISKKQVTPLPSENDLIKSSQNLSFDSVLDKVKRGVTIIAELDPPKTLDTTAFEAGMTAIDQKGIAAITLADNSLAKTRICNLSIAAKLKEQLQTPLLLHLTCRDHNLIGLQSRLLGFDLLGITNLLAITGDPSKMGDFPGATSVYDVTSFKLIELIKSLNQGQGYSGASIRKPTHFTVAAAFNPNIRHLTKAGRLIERKIAAGADYFITQPIFSVTRLKDLAQLAKAYETPFFIGIMPITSYNNAIFLHNEVPGITLSEDFLARLENIKEDKKACQQLALDESKVLIHQALELGFKGIYLITPFMRHDLTTNLIDYIQEHPLAQ